MMSAKDTKPDDVSFELWVRLWNYFPQSMEVIYDISQELPGYVGMRHKRITSIIEEKMNLGERSPHRAAVILWRDELLRKGPIKPENYFPGPGEGAPSRLVKLFYKKIRELISTYSEMSQAAPENKEEDFPSYYAGIATGLCQVENYMSNHEPWNVNHIILEMVIEQHRITRVQEANKDIVGFNLTFSKGEEEALMIIRRELVPLFFPPCRQIVVCRG